MKLTTQKRYHFALLPTGLFIIEIHGPGGIGLYARNDYSLSIGPADGAYDDPIFGTGAFDTYAQAYTAAQEYVEYNGGTMDGKITFHNSNEGLCWICKRDQAVVEGACQACYDEACEAVLLRVNKLQDDAPCG